MAVFSNYLVLPVGQSNTPWVEFLRLGEWNWRWMLGVEALPALTYYIALQFVPESPRWLVGQGHDQEALDLMARVTGPAQAERDLCAVKESIKAEQQLGRASFRALFQRSMKLVMTIGITVGVLQQITGINSVFFYSPMIFEQSGIGTNAAFMQAVLVGLTNVVFTALALMLIDRLGRRPILGFGMAGIAVCMLTLA